MNIAILSCGILLAICHVNSKAVSEKRTDGMKTLNVCLACDIKCQAELPKGKANINDYFRKITAVVNKAYKDVGMKIKIVYMKRYRNNYVLSEYTDKTEGDEALEESTLHFWLSQKFKSWIKVKKCGVGFKLVSETDPIWKMTPKEGVAAMYRACTKYGVGAVKIISSTKTMGALLTHEIGHELGAYHDCEDEMVRFQYLRKKAQLDSVKEAIDKVIENCDIYKACPQHFIMREAPLESFPYPTELSECSKAYINVFLRTKDDPLLKTMYKSDCISKK